MRPKPKTGSWVSGSSCLYKIIVGDGIFAKHLKRVPWTLQILEDAFNLRGNELNSFFEIKDALQHMLKFANLYRFGFPQSITNFIIQYGSDDLKQQLQDVEDDAMKLSASASLLLLAEVYDIMLHNGDLLDSLEIEANNLRFQPFYIDKFDNRYYYFGWDVIFRTSMDKINDSEELQESEPFPIAFSHLEFMNIFEGTSKRGTKLSDEAKSILLRISNYKRAKPLVRLKSARILNKMEKQDVAARSAANMMNLEKEQGSEDEEESNSAKNLVLEKQRQSRAERAERRNYAKHKDFTEEIEDDIVEKAPAPTPVRRSTRKRVQKVKVFPDEKISEEKIEKTISDLVSKIMNAKTPSDGEPKKKKSKSASRANPLYESKSSVIIMKPSNRPPLTGLGGLLTGPMFRPFIHVPSNTARSYSGTPVYNFPASVMNQMSSNVTNSYMNQVPNNQQDGSSYNPAQFNPISTSQNNVVPVSSTSQMNSTPSRSKTNVQASKTPLTWQATIRNNRIMQNRIAGVPVVHPYRVVRNVTMQPPAHRNPTSGPIFRRVLTAVPRYRNFIPVSRPLSSLNEPAKIISTPSGQRYKIIRYQQPPPILLEHLAQQSNLGGETIYVEQPAYDTSAYNYGQQEVQAPQVVQTVQIVTPNNFVQEDPTYENVQPKPVRQPIIKIKPAPRRIDTTAGNTLNNKNGMNGTNNDNVQVVVPAETVPPIDLEKLGANHQFEHVEDAPPDNVLEIGSDEWFDDALQYFENVSAETGNQ
uniref:Uncharacterized protein n=1 Tax=Panagrolaimus sp. JU765 TaxID=591449 RepID=A0AC34QTE8_9BILA